MSAETTTTASSTAPPITGQQSKLGYRGITVEEQTALVEAEIARRRKAAMELAAKSRLAYQQNYAATTGPVSYFSMVWLVMQICPLLRTLVSLVQVLERLLCIHKPLWDYLESGAS